MQQKSNKNLSTKERILIYLDCKGYSQYDFSKKTGLSNGFLKSGSSISSDNLKLLSNIYGDLNLIWAITGEGEMLKKQDNNAVNQSIVGDGNVQAGNNSKVDARRYYSDSPDVLRAQIDEKDRILDEKEMRIKEKDAQIKEKDAQINKLLSILSNK
jgi:hypothetical protein